MDKEGVLAAVAILVLSGVLVYAYRSATGVNAPSQDRAALAEDVGGMSGSWTAAVTDELLWAGSPNAYDQGAGIYVANTPYLFQRAVGNVIPQGTANQIPFQAPSSPAISI